MFKIGETKLLLDDAVGGEAAAEGEEGQPDKTATEVKKSLLKTLRNKFETEEDEKVRQASPVKGDSTVAKDLGENGVQGSADEHVKGGDVKME
jgi:hypothetical protein